MGSSNSSLDDGSCPASSGPNRRFKRRLIASLFCGGSDSHPPIEMDDHVDESLTGPLETLAPCCDESTNSKHDLSSTYGSDTGLTSSSSESGVLSRSSNGTVDGTSVEYRLSNVSKDAEVQPQQLNINDDVVEAHAASTSIKEPPSVASASADPKAASPVDMDSGNLHSDGESPGDASTDVHTADADSLITSQPLPGLPLSDGEQDSRATGVLFVDVVSIHSNILSGSIAEISSREARRNSRRMFWENFSRSSFRQNRDSPTIVFTTSHADDLGSHDRWLLDFSGDLRYDGVGRESTYSGARSHYRSERQWQSRSEMPERFHDVRDEQDSQTWFCAAGLHPRGTCSCESLFVAEETSNRASISQVIMLADALFEVLEEIHHHRMSLSSSTLSLPAPEAVVNSFPLKSHKKSSATEGGDHDEQQCHICLVDYEEGDKIRVLPCSHEYHMSCVDKWLKEVHGVCPLCRDDVCKGSVEDSASNPEIASL